MRDPVLNEPRIPFYQKRNNVHIPREAKSKKYLDASFVPSMGSAFRIENSDPIFYYNVSAPNTLFQESNLPIQTPAKSGDPVGYMRDLGPNKFDLIASSDDFRPLKSPESVNFDGNDDRLFADIGSLDFSNFTFIITTVVNGFGPIFRFQNLDIADQSFVTFRVGSDLRAQYPIVGGGVDTFNPVFTDVVGALTIYTYRVADGVLIVYKNGKLINRFEFTDDAASVTNVRFCLAWNNDTNFSDPELYSAVAYDRALPYDDMRLVEEKLAEDAGVVLEPWTPLYYNPYVFIDRNSSIKYQERTNPATLADSETDPVGYMTDVSQYGNDVAAPDDAARPTITGGVAIYDGVNDTLQASSLNLTNEGSVVWKIKQSDSSSSGPLWDISNAAGTRFYSFFTNGGIRARIEEGSNTATSASPDSDDVTGQIYSAILTSSSITLHTMPEDVTATNNVGFTFDITNSDLSLLHNGSSTYTNGEVECIVIFDQVMTIPELRRVAQWVIDTYGVG